MFKKLFLILMISLGLALPALASDMESIQYKNLKEGTMVSYIDGVWITKINKSDSNYFTKKISAGTGSYSEFYNPEGDFVFSTGCQYEFILDGKLYGYSNYDLKFYEFTFNEDILEQRELSQDEVQELFKNYEIIKISDFAASTNSLKIKKHGRNFKIILLNDTDRYFYNYSYSSNNAKFKIYPLKGFLCITKKGMIQFSHFGDNTKNFPWFILLVR